MQWKYKLLHKNEQYNVEVILKKLYMIWDVISIWTEEFLVEDRNEL